MEPYDQNMGGNLVLRGILLILFGAAAVFWPGLTLRTLVFIFSAFILIFGVIDLIVGVNRLFHGTQSILMRILMLIFGALEVGLGVYLLRHTYVRLSLFILLIGFALLIRGVLEIVEGLFVDAEGGHRALMVIAGVVTALAGIIMLFQPVAGGIAFVWVLGFYGLITGPLMIALALEMRNHNRPLAA